MCVSNQGTQQSIENWKTEKWVRETHFISLQYMWVWVWVCECECECEFHKSKQTHNLRRWRLRRERIQDVDWDLCSNTFSSIVQVSLDILQESLEPILHLCRDVCIVCCVNMSRIKNINSKVNKEKEIHKATIEKDYSTYIHKQIVFLLLGKCHKHFK
jgi:hypothetical protein